MYLLNLFLYLFLMMLLLTGVKNTLGFSSHNFYADFFIFFFSVNNNKNSNNTKNGNNTKNNWLTKSTIKKWITCLRYDKMTAVIDQRTLRMILLELRIWDCNERKSRWKSLTLKAKRSRRVGNLPSYDRREVCTSDHHEQRRYRQWSPPSTQQWLKQPVRSVANIVRRKKT